MHPNRARRRPALLLLLAGVVAACTGASGSEASPDRGTSAPTTTAPVATSGAESPSAGGTPAPLEDAITLRVGVFPNITHGPGLVAFAKGGTLEKLIPNATIEVVPFNSGTSATEAMFSEAIHLTFIGPNPAINAYVQSNGEAVRIISGSTSGGAFLVVRPEINDVADLKGKKIATPSLGNTQDVALRAWLKQQGLATDTAGGGDVSVTPQENATTLETFLAGTIDGAWVPEPWASRLIQEAGAKILIDERDLWPNGQYVTTHLMVAKPYLDANPEVIERVVLAVIQAVDFVNENPAEAQEIANTQIESFTTKAIGQELLEAAWNNLEFTVDPIASSLGTSASDAHELGLLEDPGDLSGLYDLTTLNALLEMLGREPVEGL